MDLSVRVEALLLKLDRAYRNIPPKDAHIYLDQIEELISCSVKEAIAARISYANGTVNLTESFRAAVGCDIYGVTIANHDVSKIDSLGIVIENRQNPGRLKRNTLYLSGAGRFSKVTIFIPPELMALSSDIYEITEKLYISGYKWILEFLMFSVRNMESELVLGLQSAMRTAFALAPKLIEHLHFFVVSDNRAFYMFDYDAANSFLHKLEKVHQLVRAPKPDLFLELLADTVSFEKTYARYVISKDEYGQYSLSEIPYKADSELFTLAETLLYGVNGLRTDNITLYPIVGGGQPNLIASFPAALESEIVNYLGPSVPRLRNIFREKQNHLRKIKTALSNTVSGSVQKAELTGNLLFYGSKIAYGVLTSL